MQSLNLIDILIAPFFAVIGFSIYVIKKLNSIENKLNLIKITLNKLELDEISNEKDIEIDL